MNYVDFMILLASNPFTYSAALVGMLAIYLLLFRKQIYSYFDPLFFAIVFTAFAATDVVFLWWLDQIDSQYLFQFIGTEATFFIGITLFCPASSRRNILSGAAATAKWRPVILHEGERYFLIVLYVLSAVVFVLTQGITYALRGIPILYASRLEYYSEGGGLGILDRVISVTWFFSCYLLMYCVATRVRIPRALHLFVASALVGSALLSGAKSTFIAILFAIFYFRFLRRGDPMYSAFDASLARLQKGTLILAVAAAATVICVQAASNNPLVVIQVLYVRFASFGDIYFMAYPKHVVDMIPGKDAFLALFGNLLAPFRIIGYDDMPESLGYQIHRIIFGFDDFTGPNARHNVFGLVYFGRVGSMFFSLALGMIVGFIRYSLSAFVRPGSAVEPLYVFLAISSVWATTDFTLVTKDIVSAITVVPVLYAVAALVCVASTAQAALNRRGQLLLAPTPE